MSSGFQSVNNNGTFQVDSKTLTFVLDRVITASTIPTSYNHSYAEISYNDGEIIALRCSDYINLDWAGNGRAIIRGVGKSSANASVQFTAYIFSNKPSNPASGVGLQVFNTSGQCVYYSGDKNLAFAGFVSGHGTFSYVSGRTYAAIFINIKSEFVTNYFGVQGNMIYVQSRTASYITNAPNGITAAYVADYSYSTQMRSSGYYPNDSWSSPACNLAIIDVTGFA